MYDAHYAIWTKSCMVGLNDSTIQRIILDAKIRKAAYAHAPQNQHHNSLAATSEMETRMKNLLKMSIQHCTASRQQNQHHNSLAATSEKETRMKNLLKMPI